MSLHDFTGATSVERQDENVFRWRAPAGWEQGRGVYGGAVIGAMARAVLVVEPDSTRAIRSVSSELVSPVPAGELVLWVERLRSGNSLSAYGVEIRKASERGEDADVLARATVVLARARVEAEAFLAIPPPVMPPHDGAPVAPIGPPLGPAFATHVEFRPTGPTPFSGGPLAAAEGWVSFRECSSWGPPEWLGLSDAYWPALLARASAPRPMVTVGYACHLLGTPSRGPLFFRSRALAAADGFVSETRELWTPGGDLVLINPQLFAILG